MPDGVPKTVDRALGTGSISRGSTPANLPNTVGERRGCQSTFLCGDDWSGQRSWSGQCICPARRGRRRQPDQHESSESRSGSPLPVERPVVPVRSLALSPVRDSGKAVARGADPAHRCRRPVPGPCSDDGVGHLKSRSRAGSLSGSMFDLGALGTLKSPDPRDCAQRAATPGWARSRSTATRRPVAGPPWRSSSGRTGIPATAFVADDAIRAAPPQVGLGCV